MTHIPYGGPVLDLDRAMGVLGPYLDGTWDRSSPEGRRRARQRLKNLVHMTGLFLWRKLMSRDVPRSSEATVKSFYEKAHTATAFAGYQCATNFVTYVFRDKVMALSGMGNYRLKSALLEQVFSQLNPISVCEAGCGRVRHLVYFAPRFPEIAFSGFDISERAIAFGKDLQTKDSFDPCLPERSEPLTAEEMARVRTITLFQASAANLSGVPDDAFDLVYTISALEQMDAIIPSVLKELRRVTRRYVVFCEPFIDANGPLERAYLWAGNYFRLHSRDLERYGFRVMTMVPLPTKPSFADCLVLAEKIR